MIVFLAAVAYAVEPVVEPLSEGEVDWTALRLLASAKGVPSSGLLVNLETLEGDARSRLGPRMLALAREVRVTSAMTAGDLLDGRDAVADRLDDNLRLWEVYEARYYTSGGVELEGALPLHPWLRPALVSLAKGKDRGAPATDPTTGLVVDARGLDVEPAVAPRLLDAAGSELYGLGTVTVMAAGQRAPVVYVADPADAAAAKRAGAQPLFVRAVATRDGCDLVLEAGDVTRLNMAAQGASFLLQGNVVVVVDR